MSVLAAFSAFAAPKLALVVDESELPSADAVTNQMISDAIRSAGYRVQSLSVEDLAKQPPETDLLVVPNARALPVSTAASIEKYLKNRGNLIAFQLPAWEMLVSRYDGKWLSREDYDRAIHSAKIEHVGINFAKENLADWKRETSNHDVELREIENGVLHVRTPEVSGWDNLSRWASGFFPAGHELTCFRARGNDATKQLAIEWRQQDSARFIATVPLSTQWRDYVLTPEDFKPWPAKKKHGEDVLDPKKVAVFSIGVSHSHTTTSNQPQEYWIGNIGTAPMPIKDRPREVELPTIEALSPFYQLYEGHDVVRCTSPNEKITRQIIIPASDGPLLQPLTQSTGMDKKRPWRWQPLLSAVSSSNDYRGTIAAMVINAQNYGGVWTSVAPTDAEFYRNPMVLHVIEDTARAISRGVFLREAGTQFYTASPGKPIRVGARVICINDDPPENARVRLTIRIPGRKEPVYEQDWPVIPLPKSGVNIYDEFKPDRWPANGFIVTTDLLVGNAVVDRISHELHQYAPPADKHFIKCEQGGFVLDGKPWKANGINYMPSSGIGLNNSEIFEQWLSSAAYDPIVIHRDLQRIQRLGFNAVSIFIYRDSIDAENLFDFLRQCRDFGLHVNLSLRPGDPFHYSFANWRDIIEHYHLAENDTIFAYDIAWEATHWDRKYQQKHYLADWRAWVLKKYSSMENAAKVWKIDVPKPLDVPLTQQLIEDGPWRNLSLDYRAFLDEELEAKYGEARRKIREIDPNHAVSFRMNTAGDPTSNPPNMLSYDFWGLRNAVDIFAPEGYGRIGDWQRVRAGMFTVAYARLCDPNKPVIWAEAGYTVWDPANTRDSESRLQSQANFYRDFYRMARESGCDGVFFWWYPGGYRVDERSDFGIINEDGTDRPVTKIIREEGAKFLAAPKPAPADSTLSISRNEDARGLVGIYEQVKQEYWRFVETGHRVQLQWKKIPMGAEVNKGAADVTRASRP